MARTKSVRQQVNMLMKQIQQEEMPLLQWELWEAANRNLRVGLTHTEECPDRPIEINLYGKPRVAKLSKSEVGSITAVVQRIQEKFGDLLEIGNVKKDAGWLAYPIRQKRTS